VVEVSLLDVRGTHPKTSLRRPWEDRRGYMRYRAGSFSVPDSSSRSTCSTLLKSVDYCRRRSENGHGVVVDVLNWSWETRWEFSYVLCVVRLLDGLLLDLNRSSCIQVSTAQIH